MPYVVFIHGSYVSSRNFRSVNSDAGFRRGIASPSAACARRTCAAARASASETSSKRPSVSHLRLASWMRQECTPDGRARSTNPAASGRGSRSRRPAAGGAVDERVRRRWRPAACGCSMRRSPSCHVEGAIGVRRYEKMAPDEGRTWHWTATGGRFCQRFRDSRRAPLIAMIAKPAF